MRTLRIICLFFALALPAFAFSQVNVDAADSISYFRSGKGVVKTDAPAQVEGFMSTMKTAEYTPNGFRVQLTSESGQGSRARADEVKAQFLGRYDDVPCYLSWDSPNYKIRIGDFRTKFEAAMFWKQLQAEFPNSYIVEDKINPGGKRK